MLLLIPGAIKSKFVQTLRLISEIRIQCDSVSIIHPNINEAQHCNFIALMGMKSNIPLLAQVVNT